VTPTARRCLSRRNFVIHLPRRARGSRVRSAVVRVKGKRVRVRRVRGRLTARIDLRGHRSGRPVRVEITLRTANRKRVSQLRRYRLCVKRGAKQGTGTRVAP
jgi:hypothetical protein